MLTGDNVKLRHSVVFLPALTHKGMAPALFGDHMQQHRTAIGAIFEVAQDRHQLIQIMTINRADIEKPELGENGAAADNAARHFLGPLGGAFKFGRKTAGNLFRQLPDRMKRA